MRLNILYLMAVVLCVFCTAANGQPIRFGFEAGAGASSFDYDQPFEQWNPGGRASFNAGIVTIIPLPKLFSLQTGARFNTFGNKVDVTFEPAEEGPDGFFSVRQSYLTVPVKLQVTPLRNGMYFFVGPEIGYLLTATMRQNVLADRRNTTLKIRDSLERPAVFVSAGIGQEISLGKRILRIQTSYLRGLTRNTKRAEWVIDWKPQDFSISAGFVL